jgi:hypothetical protein
LWRLRIVGSLIAAGHVSDDVAGDHLYAAADLSTLKGAVSANDSLRIDPKRKPAIDRVMAQVRRAGYNLRANEICDAFALDQALSASGESITNRIALKLEMKALQLLPRIS